eukprot:TRINITY_DN16869_c0_g1_i1.p1 TRINITY_DN16869_c0_g1~~TRINITY_DN16869_c0_g1_i1.p1  ORF type:complete len:442 (+),score=83.86 TRINITY_DN16869_c0_g1_i1:93-1418(+)
MFPIMHGAGLQRADARPSLTSDNAADGASYLVASCMGRAADVDTFEMNVTPEDKASVGFLPPTAGAPNRGVNNKHAELPRSDESSTSIGSSEGFESLDTDSDGTASDVSPATRQLVEHKAPVTKDTVWVRLTVVRSTHWIWGMEDGGPEQTGMVLSVNEETDTCTVLWHSNGKVARHYRLSACGDLCVALFQRYPRLFGKPSGYVKEESCIVLDWDDTLFPTTYMQQSNSTGPLDKTLMALCQERARGILQTAACLAGKVVIVTLAKPAWLRNRCGEHYPGVEDFMKSLGIKIIFARTESRDNDAATFIEMKAKAIAEELSEGQRWQHVLSIGDSDYERIGTKKATSEYFRYVTMSPMQVFRGSPVDNARTKTFKLPRTPTVTALHAELCMLQKWLPALVDYEGDLDLQIDDVASQPQIDAVELSLFASLGEGHGISTHTI